MAIVCVIPGDGIGQEVTAAALEVLDSLQVPLTYRFAEAGWACYQRHGTPLPHQTLDLARDSQAVLFGAVTTPPGIPDYFSPIVRLRRELHLYANLRPFRNLPGKVPGFQFYIVRENTEDLYLGLEESDGQEARAVRVITRRASERIARFALALAKDSRRRLTVAHKANILRKTDGLFRDAAFQVAVEFPEVEVDELLVDTAAMLLVTNPARFDVLVTTNLYGDILSDVAAGVAGGLGLAASANIGDEVALFEPVHGSAPDIAGRGIANPAAAILASAMMLDHLGYRAEASRLRAALWETIASGQVTPDLGGSLTTQGFVKEVKARL
jgi:isopropylmalate/isohomocitrate dehydrogenase-like protein